MCIATKPGPPCTRALWSTSSIGSRTMHPAVATERDTFACLSAVFRRQWLRPSEFPEARGGGRHDASSPRRTGARSGPRHLPASASCGVAAMPLVIARRSRRRPVPEPSRIGRQVRVVDGAERFPATRMPPPSRGRAPRDASRSGRRCARLHVPPRRRSGRARRACACRRLRRLRWLRLRPAAALMRGRGVERGSAFTSAGGIQRSGGQV